MPHVIRVLEVLATLKRAGAEKVAVSLATRLDAQRFATAVVSLYDPFPQGFEPVLEHAGIPVWHLGKRPGFDPKMYLRLRGVAREFRPDIIHTHSYVMRYTLHLPAAAMIHTVHNVAEREVEGFGRLVHRFAFRRGVIPVAIASGVADSFARTYGFRPAYTIPNGIETEAYWRPAARSAWRAANGFTDSDLLIVSVARLEPQKDPLRLAHAVKRIPRAHLLLAGQGSLAGMLRAQERVHLLGLRTDIPELLAAADIFASASRWEGHPLSIMEAMASGLPVAATDVGGVGEIVENGRTGVLVPPEDTEALAAALAALAEDAGTRQEMGSRGRERASAFSVENMVSRYAELFERTCA